MIRPEGRSSDFALLKSGLVGWRDEVEACGWEPELTEPCPSLLALAWANVVLVAGAEAG